MNTKTKTLSIRVSDQEYLEIEIKAKENKMAISEYIRERLFFDFDQLEDNDYKKNSFETNVIKAMSYCTAALTLMTNKTLDSNERDSLIKESISIMKSCGLKENIIKK
jgi:hypothetical protein|tara:strand:+ start:1449 stop:1772 length:324 start_codon:yes stop_codon:yes gene_type:complete